MGLPQHVPDQSLWDTPSPRASVTPVKGEEPSPVCATLVGDAPQRDSAGPSWCQSLAGPRWLCHSISARVTLPRGWAGNTAKGTWDGAPGVLQEILRRAHPAGAAVPWRDWGCRIHTECPLSIPRHACSRLPRPASASSVQHSWKMPPEQGLGGSDPSAGPLRGQAPQTLLAQPRIPKSWQGSAQPAP